MPSSLTTLLPPALGFSPCLPVSVCGTGTWQAIAAFLGAPYGFFATLVRSASRYWLPRGISPAPPPALAPGFPLPAKPPGTRPRFLLLPCSTGFSTCYPSATPSGLALGPDFPGEDQLYPGNLGHPAWGIPTPISLLIPAFSLLNAPRALTAALHRLNDAPLPAALTARLPGFGGVFQPRTFSAQGLSAGELLRTLLTHGCF